MNYFGTVEGTLWKESTGGPEVFILLCHLESEIKTTLFIYCSHLVTV